MPTSAPVAGFMIGWVLPVHIGDPHYPVDLPEIGDLMRLDEPYGGVFVSIHHRGRLRGCIGSLDGHTDLVDAVVEAAVAASTCACSRRR